MYATFEDYKDIFLKGREALIPEPEFDYWSAQASMHIDKATFNRLGDEDIFKKYKELIVNTACLVAELLYKGENKINRSSWKIGSFTENFVQEKETTLDDSISSTIKNNLGITGLLFTGVGDN